MPKVGILREPINKSRLCSTLISHVFIKIKVCLNEFLNVIFENVDVDNKMYLTCD